MVIPGLPPSLHCPLVTFTRGFLLIYYVFVVIFLCVVVDFSILALWKVLK